jgi:AcrR family transcriptional regulator
MNARSTRGPSRRAPAGKSATSTSVGGVPAQERKLRTQGKKTLRKLLDAAMIVFEKRGYHAARVDDIVKVAKTSHGTFYLYFANKEDLFRALLADVSEEMTQLSEQLPAIGPTRSGYDELRAWLGQFYDLYARYYPVIRAWTESEVGDSDLGELGVNVLGGFSNALTARVAEVDPPVLANPNIAAVAMVAMIERFSYYVLSRSLDIDRDELLDTLTSILHVGLFAGSRRKPGR